MTANLLIKIEIDAAGVAWVGKTRTRVVEVLMVVSRM